MITIKDLIRNNINPFKYENEKLKKIFSYFLYEAPNIGSIHSIKVEDEKAAIMWNEFIVE